MKLKTLKEWALYYASIGWKVFPLTPGEKIPTTGSNGFKDATTDTKQISKWWDSEPNYNIGIATGAQSGGLVVVDLDEDETKNKHGIEVFNRWAQDKHIANTIFNTLICNSPRGGMHLYYQSSAPYQKKEDIVWGIDVRAEGAYIVAPPSIHPNGKAYKWNSKQGIDKAKPIEVNQTLGAFIALGDEAYDNNPKKKKSSSTKVSNTAAAAIIPDGERVSTLISKIGTLTKAGVDSATIKETIIAMNKTQCKPPLSDHELSTQVLTALNRGWEPGENQSIDDIPDFAPISANELLKKEIPPLRYVIDEICPAGFGILAAPPKYYKSFLALQICIALSKGRKVLGKETHKTKCLYFDLESTDRRPQDRLKAMGIDELNDVDIITQEEMPKVKHRMINLSTGFDLKLEKMLKAHPEYGFIVIDVFRKIRSEQKRGQSLYDHDYEDIEKLQSIAARNNVCLLLLHHTTKFKDESDPFNNMGGSSGLLGAADFAWVIGRDTRKSKDSTLSITGRDIASQDLTIRFDTKALEWGYVGTVEEVQAQKEMDEYLQSNVVNTIKKLVATNGGKWEGSAGDIVNASYYFNTSIYDSPKKVGLEIQKYTDLLKIEGNIDIDKKRRSGGNRERVFLFVSCP